MTGKYEIVVYKTAIGKRPFDEWLSALDASVLWRIEARVERLERGLFGNTKSLNEGLYELKFQNPAFRIYYAIVGQQIILLISGGDKRKQSDDIKKSKEYLDDYRSRYGVEKK